MAGSDDRGPAGSARLGDGRVGERAGLADRQAARLQVPVAVEEQEDGFERRRRGPVLGRDGRVPAEADRREGALRQYLRMEVAVGDDRRCCPARPAPPRPSRRRARSRRAPRRAVLGQLADGARPDLPLPGLFLEQVARQAALLRRPLGAEEGLRHPIHQVRQARGELRGGAVQDLAVEELVDPADQGQRGEPGQLGRGLRAAGLDEVGELADRGVAPGQRLRPGGLDLDDAEARRRGALGDDPQEGRQAVADPGRPGRVLAEPRSRSWSRRTASPAPPRRRPGNTPACRRTARRRSCARPRRR